MREPADQNLAGSATAAEAEPRPSIRKLLAALSSPFYVRSIAMTSLLLLAVFYTLHAAQAILIPIAAAIVLQFVVSPILRGLRRLWIPDPVAAGIIIIGLVGGVLAGIYYLSGPAAAWIDRAPEISSRIDDKMRVLRRPIEQVQKASEEVERATDSPGQPRPQEVVVRQNTLMAEILGSVTSLLTGLGLTLLLTFFLLASGDLFKLKLVRIIPRFEDKKRAVAIVRDIEHLISTYLFTITLINAGTGAAIGMALYLLGLPNAALWGVMAAFLTYIPYVGPMVGAAVVAAVGFMTFDHLGYALAAPAIYVVLASIEGHLVTPSLLGRSLTLNPVVIVVNLVLWGWLWGIPGALLAGPFLIIVKVFCDHIEPLAAIGEFLSAKRA